MAAKKPTTNSGLELKHGAYSDIADLIRIRHLAKHLPNLHRSKTNNPLSGFLTSQFRGRGIDFAEVRHYEPGDDVRTIDWRVTARTQVPHTKLFQEEKERPVLILVDQSQSMFFGSSVTFKSVLAAQCAAMIAWLSLDKGDRVGGLVFSDSAHREVRPKRNKHSVLQLLNEVNDFNHALNRNSQTTAANYLSDAILKVRRVAKHGCSIFLISDFKTLDETALRHLRQLAQHNDVSAIHISDQLEQQLPQPDIYQITNGESRIQINTASKKSRTEYHNSFLSRLETVKTEFTRLRAPFVSLQTTDSPDDLLSQFERVAI